MGVQGDKFVIEVNGNIYKYGSEAYTAKELEEKFNGIAKHSKGKAFAWVKKNAKTTDSYKRMN